MSCREICFKGRHRFLPTIDPDGWIFWCGNKAFFSFVKENNLFYSYVTIEFLRKTLHGKVN
jgi:hypothetical protein